MHFITVELSRLSRVETLGCGWWRRLLRGAPLDVFVVVVSLLESADETAGGATAAAVASVVRLIYSDCTAAAACHRGGRSAGWALNLYYSYYVVLLGRSQSPYEEREKSLNESNHQ